MMAEGLERFCEWLRATDLENEKILIERGSIDDVVYCGINNLLMKLMSNRYYNREAFKTTIRKIWRSAKII